MTGSDAADFVSYHGPNAGSALAAGLANAPPCGPDQAVTPAESSEPTFRWLDELLEDPALLAPPQPLIPHLAYAGRVTLLSGREKSGKSTFVAQGVAAASLGEGFLDEETVPTTTLWLALDEPVGDLARRLVEGGADPLRVAVRTRRPDAVVSLDDLAAATNARVIVVDSLTNYASGVITEGGSAFQWQPLLDEIRAVARQREIAVILVHHANKANGTYRDSTAIAASVDLVLEFGKRPDDQTERIVRAAGRFPIGDVVLQYENGLYRVSGGEETVAVVSEQRRLEVLELLEEAEPEGLSYAQWFRESGQSRSTFNRIRRTLHRAGLVLSPAETRYSRYRITDRGAEAVRSRQSNRQPLEMRHPDGTPQFQGGPREFHGTPGTTGDSEAVPVEPSVGGGVSGARSYGE